MPNKSMPQSLSTVLTHLMSECDIDDALLAKHTGIPSSTIARLRSNNSANPTAHTLRPIANFFDITIGQLLGDEQLSSNRIPGTYFAEAITNAIIPVIDWDHIESWKLNQTKPLRWISTEKHVSDNAFAIMVKSDSFGLAFRKGSILIIDNNNTTTSDGELVLIKLSKDAPITLRCLIKDGDDLYAKPVNPELQSVKPISSESRIYGKVIECRYSTTEATEPTPSTTSSKLSPVIINTSLRLKKA